MNRLSQYTKSKISLEELEAMYRPTDYLQLVEQVKALECQGKIEPVKKPGKNGKKPSLYKFYRVIKEREEEQEKIWKQELLLMNTRLSNDYYLWHLDKYASDRHYVQLINQYYEQHDILFPEPASFNERSFELVNREKFIIKEEGKRILKNLSIDVEQLNCYKTCEPLAYYSVNREVPQTILFVENKDTYYTMRNYLQSGKKFILGRKIGTIVYGAGKRIYRSIEDLETSVEEYVSSSKNTFIYFGDMDYEGILIYETLLEQCEYSIEPFVEAYDKMLDKAINSVLPNTKEQQNRNISDVFFDYFCEESKMKMVDILREGKYIPQEIIVTRDL